MRKLIFPDIGELGWALYLAAYIKWLQKYTDDVVCVMTTPDRFCLYECDVRLLPLDFIDKYKDFPQDCFGRYGIGDAELKSYFKDKLPEGYIIPEYFSFGLNRFFDGKAIFESYKVSSNILIFPRNRKQFHHSFRNLPERFYVDLINILCRKFSDKRIVSIGSKEGAHDIILNHRNYYNKIGQTSIQDIIDLCDYSVAAIGGTSAPPKITLLQKVPTFIIGHEIDRFTKKENWNNTDVCFWEIKKEEYSTFNDFRCIDKIVEFVQNANQRRPYN